MLHQLRWNSDNNKNTNIETLILKMLQDFCRQVLISIWSSDIISLVAIFYHLFSVLFAIMVFKFIQGIKGAAAFFTSILITHCWRRRRHIYVYYCWYRRIDLKTNFLHNQLLLLLWSLFGCEFWFIKVARSKR
jgi:hypothetical protein